MSLAFSVEAHDLLPPAESEFGSAIEAEDTIRRDDRVTETLEAKGATRVIQNSQITSMST